ncbi:YkgJ family cysteine cluster protein [Halocatena halophila]|uniref:YkgJ family cysteine cluster protein n=1 Tax=Halocatena halophila TaxID=2814576 RepID=UPI002ED440B2
MDDRQALADERDRARALSTAELADAIEAIGFSCTRCGACCTAHDDEEHTATVFPDEVRTLQTNTERSWNDVARPMPYGISEAGGETFEWALQTTGCGDCAFYTEDADGTGGCTVHEDRPLICQTYPFSLALSGTSQPLGEPVDGDGLLRAHECEGLGRSIDRDRALELAATLKERAITELTEAIELLERYEPANPPDRTVVVHDSEGAKRPDGTEL